MGNLIFRLFVCVGSLLILLSLSGCYAISDPDMWPRDFVQKDEIPELVGKHEDEVLEKLGAPTYVVHKKDNISYLYQKLEDDTAIGIILYVPVMIFRHETEASCILLNFDSNYVLQGYEIETSGAARGGGYEPIEDCAELFDINDSDLVDWCVYERIGGNLKVQEEYQQYLTCTPHDPSRFSYLCHAADLGHPYAQVEVGRHFSDGIGGIRQDLRIVYVWYSLAARGCFYDVDLQLTKQKMTAREVAEAEQMLTEWKRGQCERDLPGIQESP